LGCGRPGAGWGGATGVAGSTSTRRRSSPMLPMPAKVGAAGLGALGSGVTIP